MRKISPKKIKQISKCLSYRIGEMHDAYRGYRMKMCKDCKKQENCKVSPEECAKKGLKWK